MVRLLLLFLFLFPASLHAEEKEQRTPFIKITSSPKFALPIDCNLGDDCWIMNYVDIGANDGKNTDPACFNRTYDGHKGTDFAISDGKAMEEGVNILAPMDGTIKRIRNGEPDRWPTAEDIEQVKEERKECGNAILIDHGDGLESLYCHLKKDSLTVQVGQNVKTGDVIAQVGMSGMTEFPHLHFGIIWEGAVVDPFTGQNNTGECGKHKRNLWKNKEDVQYQSLIIQAAEFSNTIPNLDQIERSTSALPTSSKTPDLLAFWVILLGSREGDIITLEIKDPNGKIFAQSQVEQNKTRARQFYYTGRKLNGRLLQEGGYTGTVKVTRTNTDGKTQEWNTVRALLVTE